MSAVALGYVRRFSALVRFEHTIFALPYAYAGAVLAADGAPSVHALVWITVAMVGARSFAMATNRLVDAAIDARNPRTAGREIPAGRLSRTQVAVFCAGSLAVFLVAVWQLPPLTHKLWPLVIAPMVVYPYLKRVTSLCHLWLGAVDGLAPVGGWVAVTGTLDWAPFVLGAAVACWIAGFDVIYATMDLDVDRAQGLHSLPADVGLRRALLVTRLLHVASVAAIAALGPMLSLGPVYYLGVVAVAALLVHENRLVRPDDLSRVDAAFFAVNGVIAVVYLAAVVLDAAVG